MVTAVIIGVLVAVGISFIMKGGDERSKAPTAGFRIAEYRQDGSRFAASGNSYVFEGTVESIETVGNDKMVCISMENNPDERLPLLVPGNVSGVNLTRGDKFLFEASCRTGVTAQGEQVKGVLVVKKVKTK